MASFIESLKAISGRSLFDDDRSEADVEPQALNKE